MKNANNADVHVGGEWVTLGAEGGDVLLTVDGLLGTGLVRDALWLVAWQMGSRSRVLRRRLCCPRRDSVGYAHLIRRREHWLECRVSAALARSKDTGLTCRFDPDYEVRAVHTRSSSLGKIDMPKPAFSVPPLSSRISGVDRQGWSMLPWWWE